MKEFPHNKKAPIPNIRIPRKWVLILAIVFGGCVIVTIFLDQVVMPAWVHSQPMVVMPDCIGKNARDAIADLNRMKFVIAAQDTQTR